MPAKKITVNRSSKSGRFVKPAYAKKHKSITETEHYKRPTKRRRKSK